MHAHIVLKSAHLQVRSVYVDHLIQTQISVQFDQLSGQLINDNELSSQATQKLK